MSALPRGNEAAREGSVRRTFGPSTKAAMDRNAGSEGFRTAGSAAMRRPRREVGASAARQRQVISPHGLIGRAIRRSRRRQVIAYTVSMLPVARSGRYKNLQNCTGPTKRKHWQEHSRRRPSAVPAEPLFRGRTPGPPVFRLRPLASGGVCNEWQPSCQPHPEQLTMPVEVRVAVWVPPARWSAPGSLHFDCDLSRKLRRRTSAPAGVVKASRSSA